MYHNSIANHNHYLYPNTQQQYPTGLLSVQCGDYQQQAHCYTYNGGSSSDGASSPSNYSLTSSGATSTPSTTCSSRCSDVGTGTQDCDGSSESHAGGQYDDDLDTLLLLDDLASLDYDVFAGVDDNLLFATTAYA